MDFRGLDKYSEQPSCSPHPSRDQKTRDSTLRPIAYL